VSALPAAGKRPQPPKDCIMGLMAGRAATVTFAAAAVFALSTVPRRAAGKKFDIEVGAILGRAQSDHVDNEIAHLAEKIRKLEPTLKGFRVPRHSQRTLAIDQSYRFHLVEDQMLSVTLEPAPGAADRVGLRLKPPEMGEIFYTQRTCPRCFPIITPYVTKDNERLIIAIKCKRRRISL